MPITVRFFILFLTLGLSLFATSAHAFETGIRKDAVLTELTTWRSDISLDTTLDIREKDLRLQLASRLLFQVERKYQETDLRKFMLATVKDMKMTDEMRDNQSYGGLSLYLESLAVGLDELIEPREDVLIFIREFTAFSSVSNPKSLDAFTDTRSYSDGKTMAKADFMETDEAGESVADKITTDQTPIPKQKSYLEFEKSLDADGSDLHFVTPITPLDENKDELQPSNRLLTEQSPET